MAVAYEHIFQPVIGKKRGNLFPVFYAGRAARDKR